MDGTIKRLVADKGFGFVKDNQTETEYFFHRSAVHGVKRFEHLREGEAVTFDEDIEAAKGPRVKRLEAVGSAA